MRLLGFVYLALWIAFAWIVGHPAQPRTIPAPLWYDAINMALNVGWFVVGCMVGLRLVVGEPARAWALILLVNIVAGMVLVNIASHSVPGGPHWSSGQNLTSIIIFTALVAIPMVVLLVERR